MSWTVAGWAGALVWSVALVVVDVRSLRLPDALTLPAVPVAVVLAVVTGHPWAVAGGTHPAASTTTHVARTIPGPGRAPTVVPHGPGMVLATWVVVLAAGCVPAW
ncbi:hypothetical protein MTQ22_05460 [Corynebacterium bovis]|uniref:hypothetical protein n=1 Tax=Corynebacterium bovis TaxID=36808 RepID=UPI0031395CAC